MIGLTDESVTTDPHFSHSQLLKLHHPLLLAVDNATGSR